MKLPPVEFVNQLSAAERILWEVKEKLYEGSWDRVLADLEARLRGEPYIYKLQRKIEQDIASIRKMQIYELRHGVDLGVWLRPAQRRSV